MLFSSMVTLDPSRHKVSRTDSTKSSTLGFWAERPRLQGSTSRAQANLFKGSENKTDKITTYKILNGFDKVDSST